ncbi:MAG TPA: diguanylate cyclase [Amaricoccus sp.]|uniref:diguanylate cyclase domain-containing protein n=1 Tax=Amaricoccus sp. TaxID=1872485 RepID=UPI002D09245D|nr:diguanylate cyclase [Amaricoccus sp.]HPG22991.1 diguanylate cyclase [Amaricoccus sp.]HRW16375.1 diguanylate cyclase [Amaricoccus sp.]
MPKAEKMLLPQDTGPTGVLATIGRCQIDQSERIRLLEAVIENFPGGISLFDDDQRMVLCNRQQIEMLEYPEDLIAREDLRLEDLFRFNAERGEYGEGDVEQIVQRRLDLVRRREAHCYDRTRPNGSIVEVRGIPLDGGGFVTTYLDVTEQRRSQALITHLAHHDPLTDLPNRMLFGDRLQTAISHVKRGGMMAVHYIDLDEFKPVNDAFGHQAGDDLLVQVAGRMAASVRESDTVARLGGDEFGIVQTQIEQPGDAEILAGRMVDCLARPFRVFGREVRISASIGIALAPDHGEVGDELLNKADRALYCSKGRGRSRYSFFDRAACSRFAPQSRI